MPTNATGLGYQHQKERRQMLQYAYFRPCEICGLVMLPSQHLDLDHVIPRVLGGSGRKRIVHRACNRKRGQLLGANRRKLRKQAAEQWRQYSSRQW